MHMDCMLSGCSVVALSLTQGLTQGDLHTILAHVVESTQILAKRGAASTKFKHAQEVLLNRGKEVVLQFYLATL